VLIRVHPKFHSLLVQAIPLLADWPCLMRRLRSVAMSAESLPRPKRNAKYRRAKIRHFIFTVGPNTLSGGRIRRRHLAQDVVVRELTISSPGWPKAFDGLRIGHVSDFHLGHLLPLERALNLVELLGEQKPDLVACTGDVVDLDHHEAGPLLDAMARLNAPLGTALVLGNHDELHCGDTLCKMALDAGITVLRNEAIEVHHNGNHMTVAGVGWSKTTSGCAKYVDATCRGEVDLLLSHNPKSFHRAAELGIPLTLAGHTHGGQIAMKNRPQASLAFYHKHSVGLFEQGPSRLYVTSGVGAWFPLRINCPAEIAMITMRSE
jgi:uncharacterized protein